MAYYFPFKCLLVPYVTELKKISTMSPSPTSSGPYRPSDRLLGMNSISVSELSTCSALYLVLSSLDGSIWLHVSLPALLFIMASMLSSISYILPIFY